jgi:hypothetical protein
MIMNFEICKEIKATYIWTIQTRVIHRKTNILLRTIYYNINK